MAKTFIKYAVLFVVLVIAQVVVFNHLCLFNVAVPLVFVYFILKLPVTLNTNWVLTLSFLLGLCIDFFSDTQGMNALACTLMGAMRRPTLRLYFSRNEDMPNPEPSLKSLGSGVFMKYALTFILFYCTFFFIIEAFTFFFPWLLVARIVASTALTFVVILAIESLSS